MSFRGSGPRAARPARESVIDRQDREAADSRIAELARELASAINSADAAGRDGMRDYAIDVLREAVRPTEEPEPAVSTAANPGPLNSFAFGIPIVLVGAVLTPLFPPLGLTLALFGVVLCVAGLVAAGARSIWAKVASRRAVPTTPP